MSNSGNAVNNIGTNNKVSTNTLGMNALFFGKDKMTATYLILIGSLLNFFVNMKQRNIKPTHTLIHLLTIIIIGLGLSQL